MTNPEVGRMVEKAIIKKMVENTANFMNLSCDNKDPYVYRGNRVIDKSGNFIDYWDPIHDMGDAKTLETRLKQTGLFFINTTAEATSVRLYIDGKPVFVELEHKVFMPDYAFCLCVTASANLLYEYRQV